jgi:hypothetical protein
MSIDLIQDKDGVKMEDVETAVPQEEKPALISSITLQKPLNMNNTNLPRKKPTNPGKSSHRTYRNQGRCAKVRREGAGVVGEVLGTGTSRHNEGDGKPGWDIRVSRQMG